MLWGQNRRPDDAREQKELPVDAQIAPDRADLGQRRDGLVDADVAVAVVEIAVGPRLEIDRRPRD